MDFSLSEERKMLQETVGRFFENNYKDIKKRGEYLKMTDGCLLYTSPSPRD